MKLTTSTIPGAKALALLCLLAGAAAAQDADGDGLDDAYEMVLAEMFAPFLAVASGETNKPSTVEWYLNRLYDNGGNNGGLRFHHIGCSDDPILGTPSVMGLVTQYHQPKTSWPGCNHNGPNVFSGNAVPYDPGSNDGFFLQIPNSSIPLQNETRSGMPVSTDWRAYVHVEASKTHPDHYNIQYFWFYPFAGKDFANTYHREGDWENVTFRVKADTLTLSAVHCSSNGSGGAWYPPSAFIVNSLDGRIRVYAAKYTHETSPSYPPTGAPTVQDFAGRLVPLGELWNPRPGQEWLRYGGRWGEIGGNDGPSGPALMPSWKLEAGDSAPASYHFVSTGPDTAPVPNTHASVTQALLQASPGSTIWLLDGNYADLQSPTYTVPPGTVFDRNQIWTAGLSGAVVIKAP